jgi:uncharacterized HAD superfamily protein
MNITIEELAKFYKQKEFLIGEIQDLKRSQIHTACHIAKEIKRLVALYEFFRDLGESPERLIYRQIRIDALQDVLNFLTRETGLS